MVSLSTIISIVSASLALLRWFVNYSQQQKWLEQGEADTILKALQSADENVKNAKQARQDVRDQLSVIPLASCKTTMDFNALTTKVSCESFEPIRWSKKDTAKTVEQVKEHNAAGKAICGWK
jgi:hypothetical protein